MNEQDYLGDGVYVKYDGFGIWVMANHHEYPTDKVYFEPAVIGAFIRFLNKFRLIEKEDLNEQKSEFRRRRRS